MWLEETPVTDLRSFAEKGGSYKGKNVSFLRSREMRNLTQTYRQNLATVLKWLSVQLISVSRALATASSSLHCGRTLRNGEQSPYSSFGLRSGYVNHFSFHVWRTIPCGQIKCCTYFHFSHINCMNFFTCSQLECSIFVHGPNFWKAKAKLSDTGR